MPVCLRRNGIRRRSLSIIINIWYYFPGWFLSGLIFFLHSNRVSVWMNFAKHKYRYWLNRWTNATATTQSELSNGPLPRHHASKSLLAIIIIIVNMNKFIPFYRFYENHYCFFFLSHIQCQCEYVQYVRACVCLCAWEWIWLVHIHIQRTMNKYICIYSFWMDKKNLLCVCVCDETLHKND